MATETITLRKDALNEMLQDFEHLIEDFEAIVEQDILKDADKRIGDIKNGKVKGYSEEDFKDFLKKRR